MKDKDNANVGIVTKLDPNYESAYLTQDKAAQVTKAGFGTNASISYDVTGDVIVPGVKLFSAKPTLGRDAKYAKDVASILNDINKNSFPFSISEYKGEPQLANCKTLHDIVKHMQNVTYIRVPLSEDVQFINVKAFDVSYVFDSNDYNATLDAKIEDMINAKPDEYNRKYRRIAKLAKAIKMAVLAQTNDTNPFYTMHVSELFDRLVDYFARVNNIVATYYNVNYFVGSVADILMVGDKEAYAQYNATTYSGANRIDLAKTLAKLKASLVGVYYDPEQLESTLNFAVMGLNPFHKGSAKFICPTISHNLNGGLGGLYIPSATDNHTAINGILNSMINMIYSNEFSLISTGLASFNGVPMLGDLPEKCVLQPKQKLISWIQAHEITGNDIIPDISYSSSNIIPNGSKAYRPRYRGMSGASQVLGGKGRYNTISYISKFNGIRTTVGVKAKNSLPISATTNGKYISSDVNGFVEQSTVGGSEINKQLVAQYLALSKVKNISDGNSNTIPQVLSNLSNPISNATTGNPHILYDEYHGIKYLPTGIGSAIALNTIGWLNDADVFVVLGTGTTLNMTNSILYNASLVKGSSYAGISTKFTISSTDDGTTHTAGWTDINILSLVDEEFTPNIVDDYMQVTEGNLCATNTVVTVPASTSWPIIGQYATAIFGWNPYDNKLLNDFVSASFNAAYYGEDFSYGILSDYQDRSDLTRLYINSNKSRLLNAYSDYTK